MKKILFVGDVGGGLEMNDLISIENEIEELFERVENIEKQIKEVKEEQLKKLKAELDYAKFRCTLPNVVELKGEQDE
jgi:hypothetical protein